MMPPEIYPCCTNEIRIKDYRMKKEDTLNPRRRKEERKKCRWSERGRGCTKAGKMKKKHIEKTNRRGGKKKFFRVSAKEEKTRKGKKDETRTAEGTQKEDISSRGRKRAKFVQFNQTRKGYREKDDNVQKPSPW